MAAWPVVGATFVMLQSVQQKPEQGREVLKFFDWVFGSGTQTVPSLDYISLPESVVKEIRSQWRTKVKDAAGKPVFD